jgi:hypothetical protein
VVRHWVVVRLGEFVTGVVDHDPFSSADSCVTPKSGIIPDLYVG